MVVLEDPVVVMLLVEQEMLVVILLQKEQVEAMVQIVVIHGQLPVEVAAQVVKEMMLSQHQDFQMVV